MWLHDSIAAGCIRGLIFLDCLDVDSYLITKAQTLESSGRSAAADSFEGSRFFAGLTAVLGDALEKYVSSIVSLDGQVVEVGDPCLARAEQVIFLFAAQSPSKR